MTGSTAERADIIILAMLLRGLPERIARHDIWMALKNEDRDVQETVLTRLHRYGYYFVKPNFDTHQSHLANRDDPTRYFGPGVTCALYLAHMPMIREEFALTTSEPAVPV
jgi:hypothetical protein